jgi:hypothetical protein
VLFSFFTRSFKLFLVNQRSETPKFSIVTYAAKKPQERINQQGIYLIFSKKIEEVEVPQIIHGRLLSCHFV